MYSFNGMVDLAWSASERDLGVMVDNKLTFSEEISCRIKKANTVMGIIRRTSLGVCSKRLVTNLEEGSGGHRESAAESNN
jgi:hypothetical protein